MLDWDNCVLAAEIDRPDGKDSLEDQQPAGGWRDYISPEKSAQICSNNPVCHLVILQATTMKSILVPLVSLVTLGECLSLPPLIPSIPGVTDVLTNIAPPLPILQIPTPPLESPPFTPSDIKPKKIGYFWTGSADKKHKGTWRFLPYVSRLES